MLLNVYCANVPQSLECLNMTMLDKSANMKAVAHLMFPRPIGCSRNIVKQALLTKSLKLQLQYRTNTGHWSGYKVKV